MMRTDQIVRFLQNERGGAWRKGEFGVVLKQLAPKPLSQDDIYLVKIREKIVWAVGMDIESFDQLRLF